MLRYCPLLIVALCFGVVQPAFSRPVSYPGGWTSMLASNLRSNALHVHYSPTASYSLGYRVEHFREDDFTAHTLQINHLLKRWNGPASQGNLYLMSGLGLADTGISQASVEPVVFSGIAADWENRRWFFSYRNRYTYANNVSDFFVQSARIGIAPYIGDYGDLHTWLMVEVDHAPESSDSFTVTPLIRFLKGSNLVETGVSTDGDLLFNWIRRY